MKKSHIIKFPNMLLILMILITFPFCGSSNRTTEYDLNHFLERELNITDDIFSPKQIGFFSTVEQLFEVTGLNEDSIYSSEESDGYLSVIVTNKVKVADLDDEMLVTYRFFDDKLVSVNYSIPMNASEKDKVCEILYNQVEAMQLPKTNNISLEAMKEGNSDYTWRDDKQNSISFIFPTVPDDESDIVIFNISLSKNSLKEALSK